MAGITYTGYASGTWNGGGHFRCGGSYLNRCTWRASCNRASTISRTITTRINFTATVLLDSGFVDDLCVHLDSLIGLGNVCAFSASVSPEQTEPEIELV